MCGKLSPLSLLPCKLRIKRMKYTWSSASGRPSVKVLSVCCSGALGCVLTQCQGGKTPAVILEKQLLLPINLGKVKRPFADYLQSIVKQRERLFTSGKNDWLMMIWACSAATEPGHLAVIESTMNSSVYQSILDVMMHLNVKASV